MVFSFYRSVDTDWFYKKEILSPDRWALFYFSKAIIPSTMVISISMSLILSIGTAKGSWLKTVRSASFPDWTLPNRSSFLLPHPAWGEISLQSSLHRQALIRKPTVCRRIIKLFPGHSSLDTCHGIDGFNGCIRRKISRIPLSSMDFQT